VSALAVVYFLRKRSSRTTSPPPAGLSESASDLVSAGSGLAATGTATLVCVMALCSAGGRAASRSLPAGTRSPRFPGFLAPFLVFSLRFLLGFGARHFFELQAKLHRRIEEPFHRREGHGQPLRHAAERHADLEAALGHHEIPELVLQDDGHLRGI